MTRTEILAKPKWQGMATFPELLSLPLDQLRALDDLIDFMSNHGITLLTQSDARAWARLSGGVESLAAAQKAVVAVEGADAPELPILNGAEVDLRRCHDFGSFSRVPRRAYTRTISVYLDELPVHWRQHIERINGLRQDGMIKKVDDLYDRMLRKLCQYAWFMQVSGLDIELNIEGLQAFYEYESTRDSNRGGPLRPATILATFADLRDFMGYCGDYPDDLLNEMQKAVKNLEKKAEGVVALKYAALANIDVTTIQPRANAILHGASKFKSPAHRHVQRNRALALGLPPLTPLRREWHELRFGRDIVCIDGRYRFRDYKLRKNRHRPGRENYPGSVHPSAQHFVDAVLLQDEDDKYLDALRLRAEQENWPLFAHPDKSEVAVNYVSQVWSTEFDTGAHINRTIVYDVLFALGEDATYGGTLMNDHQSAGAKKDYIGTGARVRALAAASDARDELFGDFFD